METTATHTHRTLTTAAGLLCLATAILAPAPAQALRLPADPVAFVPTPPALSRVIVGAQADNIRAALDDLRTSQGE